uniref:Myozenin-2-like n=1 Tax=Sinocyclocheilus rhinocerous TaxID=307959 RepID=A0A673K9P9_9TELE
MNLGKKISVPKDVMMEELNLNTNRGSIMFQQRQRRLQPSNHSGYPSNRMAMNQKNIYSEHLSNCLATPCEFCKDKRGYSGPLREIPREKFNATVIPKSYCSPWQEALGENEELLSSLNTQIAEPPQKLPDAMTLPFGDWLFYLEVFDYTTIK